MNPHASNDPPLMDNTMENQFSTETLGNRLTTPAHQPGFGDMVLAMSPLDVPPPPRLRARVMASYNAHYEAKKYFGLKWLLIGKIHLPVPLAAMSLVVGACLVTWSFLQTPEILVMTPPAPHPLPGPSIRYEGIPPSPTEKVDKPPATSLHQGSKETTNSSLVNRRGGAERTLYPAVTTAEVRFSTDHLSLLIDGGELAASSGVESGSVFWISAGQEGDFVLALFPFSGADTKLAGWVEKNRIGFEGNGTRYEIQCSIPVVSGVGRRMVWIKHIPVQSNQIPAGTAYAVGLADNLSTAQTALEKIRKQP